MKDCTLRIGRTLRLDVLLFKWSMVKYQKNKIWTACNQNNSLKCGMKIHVSYHCFSSDRSRTERVNVFSFKSLSLSRLYINVWWIRIICWWGGVFIIHWFGWETIPICCHSSDQRTMCFEYFYAWGDTVDWNVNVSMQKCQLLSFLVTTATVFLSAVLFTYLWNIAIVIEVKEMIHIAVAIFQSWI